MKPSVTEAGAIAFLRLNSWASGRRMALSSGFPASLVGISRTSAIEGSIAMAVDQKIRDALKLSKLKTKLPKNPRVVDIRVEEYVDTDGEDALRMTVILDEDVEVEKLRGEDIIALKWAIRQRVREQGVELVALHRLAKQSELDELERKTRNEPCTKTCWSRRSRLATIDAKKPKQANLRRAISSAYYAVFHLLVDEACRVQIRDATQSRRHFVRCLEGRFAHGVMKEACKSFGGGTLKKGVAKGLPAGFTVPAEIRGLQRPLSIFKIIGHLGGLRFDRAASSAPMSLC